MSTKQLLGALLFVSLANSQDSILSSLSSGQGLIGLLDRAFKLLDKNPTDGVITENEADRVFTAYDKENDGNITRKEFEETALKNKVLDDLVFDFFDKNHTGFLEHALLHKYFNEVDTNGDGHVTHSEYHTYMFKLALQMFGLDGLLG